MITLPAVAMPTERAEADGSLTLSIPINLRPRGRRHCVQPLNATPRRDPTALQRALTRAHRWLRMLEAGETASISDLARREGEDFSYVARMLNLTLLAPDVVAAILDESLPGAVRLHDLAINPPILWEEQRAWLARADGLAVAGSAEASIGEANEPQSPRNNVPSTSSTKPKATNQKANGDSGSR